jgi:CheY-like chemotaxis protein
MTPPPRAILVVDDDPSVRRLITVTLSDIAGYVFAEAGNGHEAIDRAREISPRIVFLDIEMPGLDGIEACRRLRAEPTTAHATIVILTGDAGEDAEAEAHAAGADLYLTKPFSPLRLLRLVDGMASER